MIVGENVRNMGRWKIRKYGKKGNQTTGRAKGIKLSPLEKYMCRSNRSWKHPLYGEIMAKLGMKRDKEKR